MEGIVSDGRGEARKIFPLKRVGKDPVVGVGNPMLTDEEKHTHFPSLREITYLNTAAEGIPVQASREAMDVYFSHKSMGMAGRELLFEEEANCRESAAGLLGLSASEVSFCSCTSEAYNLLCSSLELGPEDEVVITDLDFPSGATPWIQAQGSPQVNIWKSQGGGLGLSDLDTLLNEKTKLVQVSLVSFLTGYRIEWPEFHDLVRAKAPNAILSVDVTQAFGRVELDCLDADCIIGSSYKWLLGTHGSCVVAVPEKSREKITVRAGGWYHLENAFAEDRFTRAVPFPGAKGFAVGMPAFPSIYALRAGIDFLREQGVAAIAKHADSLVAQLHEGLADLGVKTMSPHQPGNSSGIVSFQSEDDAAIHDQLLEQGIHVMHQAGRIRIAIHGYNRSEDIDAVLKVLAGG